MTEIQRDWARTETSRGMLKIALERGGALGTKGAGKFDRMNVAAERTSANPCQAAHNHKLRTWRRSFGDARTG